MKFGMGQPVPREEDPRLLAGAGRYTDDHNLPGQAHGVVVRSPHANARLAGIDAAAALDMPGVVAVLTGADAAADGLGQWPCLIPRQRPGGAPMYLPPHPVLPASHVRYVGDPVAFVVAETAAQARDAAEMVAVDYAPLTALTDTAAAEEAQGLWPDCPDNVCFVFEQGDAEAVARAFDAAHHVSTLDFTVTRVAGCTMEPRAALGAYDPFAKRYTLCAGTQTPHHMREILAQSLLKVPEAALRVISPDMGGGFGLRSSPYPEYVLVLWAAKRIGRPVKWTCERGEAFLSDEQARDNVTRVALALDRNGRFLALRCETVAAMGAYLSPMGPIPSTNNLGSLAGVYTTPAIHARVTGVFTNTPPIAPYRGAGRPEASYAVERVIDQAAREMGLDRVDLRRRNTIATEAMPFRTGLVFTYDSGDFGANLERALEMAGAAEFESRRAEAAGRGRLRGLGIANVVEQAAGNFEEFVEIRFNPSGTATLAVGTHSHGQGHETMFKQLLAEALGIDFENVHILQGDTDAVQHGRGTFGSRSSGLAGAALRIAAERIVAKGREIAAHHLEVAPADVAFADSRFTVAGTDRGIDLAEVARLAYRPAMLPKGMEPGLHAHGTYVPTAPTFPNGCHISEVEIDPDTGEVAILRYCVVDDVGNVINPMLVKGQLHGGIVQGLAQVTMEAVRWDPETGQPLTGSLMDYALPRASDVPSFEIATNEVPTAVNPLGVKGAGEAGCVGALPCVMNAIVDALAPLGITTLDMPATPERVWRAIQVARAAN